jgi:hypothetical protein
VTVPEGGPEGVGPASSYPPGFFVAPAGKGIRRTPSRGGLEPIHPKAMPVILITDE